MHSNYRQSVRNKWLKRHFHQLKQFRAENCLGTFRTKSVDIWLKKVFLQSNCIEKCQDQDFWEMKKFI